VEGRTRSRTTTRPTHQMWALATGNCDCRHVNIEGGDQPTGDVGHQSRPGSKAVRHKGTKAQRHKGLTPGYGSPESPKWGNHPFQASALQSVRQPITQRHTNRLCPEPSARPGEKTNTSILTDRSVLDNPPVNLANRDIHNEV
jgi:hypothetical protein